jgi:hypothetical protein
MNNINVFLNQIKINGSFFSKTRQNEIDLFAYSRTGNFSAIWQLSPFPVTGLQI